MPRHKTGSKALMEDRKNSGNGKSSGSPKKSLHDLEKEFTASDTPTDIEEVWFAGAHCGESISVLKGLYIPSYEAKIFRCRWGVRC
jgi:hypothetical protein